ncbi:TPA: peptide-methionine (S)-S-oxide reductase [Patescibacteria group bacterium]|uniref:Peptide methionine sulfoxide reductase MsrA n=1 Tax=Candidatus Gottesmanbacteria bacterium GW2011_GWA1_43_11 TaxID=1618436 RepID=A0A0G1FH36_9BACT|nr:MAG: Peptide methionine sulfoxide reductase MsrA [Candidatus Gottesmanbacteria bacterium GW2011_GWA1_43_11]HCS78811.1 peptide-methionine (S)-S-oxide reductase [Patescibacteria group bacterium]
MNQTETVTLAGGCFWCAEAIFKKLKGVVKVISGYSGGKTQNPTYAEVSSGTIGHAETIQITFDPTVISLEQVYEVFFKLHDPTTLNRQGNDVGSQYRSAIFYHSPKQKASAEKVKQDIVDAKLYPGKIVTEIVPFTRFYPAEEHHQDYYTKNSYQPYCQLVIDPKITKLYKTFPEMIKPEYK